MNIKFLEEFRNLENELRLEGTSVLDYENSLKDSSLQEKLKLCRITRNYLVHQDNSFIVATKEMVSFLNKLTLEIRLQSKLVKDCVKKIKPVYLNTSFKQVIPLCAKSDVPVVDRKTGQFLFMVDCSYLIMSMAKNVTKITQPKVLSKYDYVCLNERVDSLMKDKVYIVTSDGTKNGKYIGAVTI